MRGVLMGLMIGIMTVLVGSAARADERIGLSRDGTTWAEELPSPLFDPDVRWVPGDVDEPRGLLPGTGGPAVWTIVVGLVLTALGITFTSTRTRKAARDV